ncbi:alpha/beta hydrolase [Oxynema aestuarii]|uniref:Alpha/beta hydrolase n=1 Tax=Oxynema aestuarii AP17 TaxID=2064643 RepID=A0A6H1U0J2_9CYAN|nr:alpha/beta hydrolase [Oxynema aestuarii]QIZ72354.1 alpha/beta hydrolase [Oxynema aestuarii AP17]RMH78566.1 MAG: alpha/beta hydrolase [Cyanobacteria bacterium J007]
MKFRLPLRLNVRQGLTRFAQRWFKWVALALAVFLATTSVVVLNTTPTVAQQKVVEKVTLTYGPQRLSIPVSDLEMFATTGERSNVVNFIINVTDQEPELFRNVLTTQIPANLGILDDSLNFILGELVLYEIGQVIHPPSRRLVIEALRASIVNSASDDSQVSLLEVIQNFPAQELIIEGRQLNKAYGQVRFLVEGVETGVQFLRDELGDLIC